MSAKRCATCGAAFYVDPGDDWKTLCLPCWKKTKAKDSGGAPFWTPADTKLLRLSAENDALAAEVAHLRAALAEARTELDPDALRLLRQLCHPDRHNNSAASQQGVRTPQQIGFEGSRMNLSRTSKPGAGVAVYSSDGGPLVFLSPHAVALPECEQAHLLRLAARALTAEAHRRERATGQARRWRQ